MLTRKELKKNARQAMGEAKPSMVWVTLALAALLLVMQVLSWSLNGFFKAYETMYQAMLAGELVYVEPEGATGFAWVLTLAMELISMVLAVGYTLYCMRVNRRVKAGFGDVLDGFGLFFRAIWVNVLPAAIIGLWSFVYAVPVSVLMVLTDAVWPMVAGLPLLIPMVMASYSYRLTTYLVLDNPQRTCIQCLAMSRQVMRGHRWELFKLDLSFLGWIVLCIVPFVGLWVQPYVGVTRAAWYEAVMGAYLQEHGQTMPNEGPEEMAQDKDDTIE
jgi:uncharacterized membrane protein